MFTAKQHHRRRVVAVSASASEVAIPFPGLITKMATAGDSVVGLGFTADTYRTNVSLAPIYAQKLSPRIEIVNYAFGGSTSANLENLESGNPAQIPAALASSPDTISIQTGLNDVDSGVHRTLAAYQANIISACATVRAAGVKVVVCTLPQRSDALMDAASQVLRHAYNSWLVGVAVGDIWDALVRLDNTSYGLADGETVNPLMSNGSEAGVHPNPLGSLTLAAPMVSFLESNGRTVTETSLFGASTSMTGTTGVYDGNFSGTLAENWQAGGAVLGGVSGVFSKIAASAPDEEGQQITLSGTATTTNWGLLLGPAVTASSAQDVVVRLNARTVGGSVTGLVGIALISYVNAVEVDRVWTTIGLTDDYALMPATFNETITSKRLTVASGATVQHWIELQFRDGAVVSGSLGIFAPDILAVT